MGSTYHHFTNWVHRYPVSTVAWVCTAIVAIVLVALAAPAVVRRVRLDGDRAVLRIALLITAGLGALAVVVALDSGYRTHVGQTYAKALASQTSETLVGRNPIPTDQYYSLQPNLMRNRAISGVIPEIRIGTKWRAGESTAIFGAALVGLPPYLRSSFRGSLSSSPGLKHMVNYWQSALGKLHEGHAYVSESLAHAEGIKAQDTIVALTPQGVVYVAIDGTVPDGQIAGSGPAVVLSLADAQKWFHYGANVSNVQVIYTARGPNGDKSTRAFIKSHSQNVGVARIVRSGWTLFTHITVQVSSDFDRWLAILAAIAAMLAACGLWFLGRRPKRMPVRESRIEHTNRQESVQLHTR